MSNEFPLATAEIGAVRQPPCEPPVEIIQAGPEWLVREFKIKGEDATVFSRHGSRMDAMRAGKTRMDDNRHPCLLRWDTPDSVGDIYWNELFECLHVEQSELLQGWAIVPADDFFVFQCAGDLGRAFEYARAVQRQYDFKHLEVLNEDGSVEKSVDHRFLRHSITDSGVKFDRDRPLRTGGEGDGETANETSRPDTGEVRPPSTLMAAVPDFTELERLGSTGPIHTYRAPWTGGRRALIDLLDPERATDDDLVEQFGSTVEQWQWLADDERVTTVYDTGKQSDAWVAYREGEGSVGELVLELSDRSRLQVVADAAAALETAIEEGVTDTDVRPETVRVVSMSEPARATVADWGLTRAVQTAVGEDVITPYTAPEQLEGKSTETTSVYQLGALAYYLFCDRTPFSDTDELERAILTGALRDPTSIVNVPPELDTAILRAMATDPDDRYSSPTDFTSRLANVLR